MCIAYINIYILKFKSRSVNNLSDAQKNWRAAYNMDSHEESNFMWRIKPIVTPHVSVKFSRRFKAINWFAIIWVLLLGDGLTLSIDSAPFLVITLIFFTGDILYLLDMIFGLYAETEGVCTGVVRKEPSRSSNRVYYEVYVTDFSNKTEIKFRVYDYCNYRDRDKIKVIHGSFSKKVIESKRMAQ